MSRVKRFFSAVALSAALLSCGGAIEESSDFFSVSLESIEWLVGEWQDKDRPNQWEIWEKDGDQLKGIAIHVRNNQDTTIFERMTISQDDGTLIFTAMVRENKEPVQFRAQRIESNLVLFENPQHDFPKYIAYTLLNIEDAIVDVLETEAGDGERGVRTQLLRRK